MLGKFAMTAIVQEDSDDFLVLCGAIGICLRHIPGPRERRGLCGLLSKYISKRQKRVFFPKILNIPKSFRLFNGVIKLEG